MKKEKIIFVGSFANNLDDGRIGGQMIACNALIKSDLKNNIDWLLLDTTAVLPIQPVIIRSFKALRRILKLFKFLIFKKPDSALIFSSSGFSFLEKGLMAHICHLFKVKVFYASRSGLILNDLNKTWMKKYISSVFSISTKVICQGEEWKKTFMNLKKNQLPDKYEVIHNWVDINTYKPVSKNIEKININLLFLGWVKDYKGIFDLLEALNKIKHQTPNLVVNICGNGDDYVNAVELSKEFGIDEITNFLGWINHKDKIEQLNKADIYVIPSHFEGFPNALLEAMSCGLPVVATNVGAISTAIDNNQNGILINPKAPEELAKAILSLYENDMLRKKLGFAARLSVEENFSKQYAIKKFKNILVNAK